MNVVALPTDRAINLAWHAYADLVMAQAHDESLRANRRHQEAIVRAHVAWSDLFKRRLSA